MPGDEEARVRSGGREHRAEHQQRGIQDQHPTLGKMLGQKHSQDRPDGIAGVGHARGETHRLETHMQVLAR